MANTIKIEWNRNWSSDERQYIKMTADEARMIKYYFDEQRERTGAYQKNNWDCETLEYAMACIMADGFNHYCDSSIFEMNYNDYVKYLTGEELRDEIRTPNELVAWFSEILAEQQKRAESFKLDPRDAWWFVVCNKDKFTANEINHIMAQGGKSAVDDETMEIIKRRLGK